MDSPSTPSIMGSENAKFSDPRRHGMSDSDSSEFHNNSSLLNGPSSAINPAKLRDGLSREERMKLVRERQLEEHRRRLDELRQAQIQAMKAKQQLDDDRRRRVEDIKSREEQRRSAVEERRRRIEDIERNRREAILRKHQEIFEKIDMKRRQHESRKMAFGTSTYRLTDQDSVYTSPSSRRAVSAGALSSRKGNRPRTGDRSHHQSSMFSSGSAKSARLYTSPSTPSKNGGLLESISGNISKTNSSENSPVHSGRQHAHFRITQSHPPPVTRNRVPESARTPRGGQQPPMQHTPRPHTAYLEPTARAKRPSTLVTPRDNEAERGEKNTSTFRVASKRSQSVGNVSGRKREARPETTTEAKGKSGRSHSSQRDGDVSFTSDEERHEEFVPPPKLTFEPETARTAKKIASESEAKAALAEKRRLARLKAEAERNEVDLAFKNAAAVESTPGSRDTPEPSMCFGVEHSSGQLTIMNDLAPPRSPVFPFDDKVDAADQELTENAAETVVRDVEPERFSPVPKNSMGAELLSDDESEVAIPIGYVVDETEGPREEVVEDDKLVDSVIWFAEVATNNGKLEEPQETVVRPTEQPEKPEPVELPAVPVVNDETFVRPAPSEADKAREELERRRMETEQREEEERQARRQRLEAIKRLTKNANGPPTAPLSGSTERLASPVNDSKPLDALENARKLLQRRNLRGNEGDSLVSSPSSGNIAGGSGAFDGKMTMSASFDSSSFGFQTESVSLGAAEAPGRVGNGTVGAFEENGFQYRNGSVPNGLNTTTLSESSIHSATGFDPYHISEEWNGRQDPSSGHSDPWNNNSKHAVLTNNGSDLLLNFENDNH